MKFTRVLLATLLLGGCSTYNKKLVLKPAVEQELSRSFLASPDVEFAFCAYGKVGRTTLRVDRITFPRVYGVDRFNIWYEDSDCAGPNLIGVGHSHTWHDDCDYSEDDEEGFFEKDGYLFLVCSQGDSKVTFRHFSADSIRLAWAERQFGPVVPKKTPPPR